MSKNKVKQFMLLGIVSVTVLGFLIAPKVTATKEELEVAKKEYTQHRKTTSAVQDREQKIVEVYDKEDDKELKEALDETLFKDVEKSFTTDKKFFYIQGRNKAIALKDNSYTITNDTGNFGYIKLSQKGKDDMYVTPNDADITEVTNLGVLDTDAIKNNKFNDRITFELKDKTMGNENNPYYLLKIRLSNDKEVIRLERGTSAFNFKNKTEYDELSKILLFFSQEKLPKVMPATFRLDDYIYSSDQEFATEANGVTERIFYNLDRVKDIKLTLEIHSRG